MLVIKKLGLDTIYSLLDDNDSLVQEQGIIIIRDVLEEVILSCLHKTASR